MDPIAPKVLLVGEDSDRLQEYANMLEAAGHSTRIRVGKPGIPDDLLTFRPHLILAEMQDREMDWKSLLREVQESQILITIILIVAHETLNEAVEAIKAGATDFLIRPFDPETLLIRVRKALENRQLHEEFRNLQRELRFRRNQDYIVGASPKIQFLLSQIIKMASSDLNVLIMGETGTGKELVARAIHYNNSKRASHPFIVINCSVIPEQLLENELFGHVKGSYTGADSTVKGLYEEADGGTLFLDEIGDLPLSLQTKLLRVLESGEFRKVGGIEAVRVDVRVLTATHKNLNREIEQGRFREDLYYRLNTFPIHVPPLRERIEDIPLLVNHLFQLYQKELNKKLEGFSASAIQKLMFYHWPGNVRELENRVRQAMINVLRITSGNVAEAARLAKKDRKDFYDVMRKYKLRSQDFRKP